MKRAKQEDGRGVLSAEIWTSVCASLSFPPGLYRTLGKIVKQKMN